MDNKPEATQAVIVGVNIPFWDLVILLVKYAFAAIPALLIIGLVLFLLSGLFVLLDNALGAILR